MKTSSHKAHALLVHICAIHTPSCSLTLILKPHTNTHTHMLEYSQAHALTVTQLAWSHSGRFLASASRDRSFAIFERSQPNSSSSTSQQQLPSTASDGGQGAEQTSSSSHHLPNQHSTHTPPSFTLRQRVKVAHSRVLWGITWSHDDALLATASRDNTVKLWQTADCYVGGNSSGSNDANAGSSSSASNNAPAGVVSERPCLTLPPFPSAVTAVAFAPRGWSRSASASSNEGQSREGSASNTPCKLLAVGLESGALQLWGIEAQPHSAQQQGEGVSSQSSTGQQRTWTAWPVWHSSQFCCHSGAVNAVAWRQTAVDGQLGSSSELQFATCSDDHSMRVFAVDLEGL